MAVRQFTMCRRCGTPTMNERFCSRACQRAPRQTLVEAFWSRVAIGAESDCWKWLGAVGANGRGAFRRQGITRNAAKWAWILTHGDVQPELCVCHRCDNPMCCNPAHLFLGTSKDNAQDMISKGRQRVLRGTERTSAKLTDDAVREIRYSRQKVKVLAEKFGVSPHTVSAVRNRPWRHWKHVAQRAQQEASGV